MGTSLVFKLLVLINLTDDIERNAKEEAHSSTGALLEIKLLKTAFRVWAFESAGYDSPNERVVVGSQYALCGMDDCVHNGGPARVLL
ncbi:hypothetical protein Ancab_038173 [Ancistrocladus abbreviatus]